MYETFYKQTESVMRIQKKGKGKESYIFIIYITLNLT